MAKFRIKITRTEVYEREVEIEADNARAAIEKAKENERENEYSEMFDCPDDVRTDFAYAGAGEKGVVRVPPFSTMTVTAKVDWDVDEGDEAPDPELTLTLTEHELKFTDVVDAGDVEETDWFLDEEGLERYISDKLTDETGFCHNGFTFDYKLNKGE